MSIETSDSGLRVLARWHREHHAARHWMPSGELADVARCNLRALGREETAEAVEAEVVSRSLEKAVQLRAEADALERRVQA